MHHPNYPNQNRSYELPRPDPGDEPDVRRYMEYVKRQVRELCTRYGEIHGFWWDANVMKHRDSSVNRLIRRLQPKAIICMSMSSNRSATGFFWRRSIAIPVKPSF